MLQARLLLLSQLSGLVRMVFDIATRLKVVGFVVILVAIAMNLTVVNFAAANQFCFGNPCIKSAELAGTGASVELSSSELLWKSAAHQHYVIKFNYKSSIFKRAITSTPDKKILITEKFLHVARNLVNIPVYKRNNYELTAQTTQIFDDKTKIDF